MLSLNLGAFFKICLDTSIFSAHPRCKHLSCFSLLRNNCCFSVYYFARFVLFVLRQWCASQVFTLRVTQISLDAM